ncbi:MAG TPA: inverse autotransporter beta domain-containing protein [Alphaproteobacteria bacterium]|jgi:hypothetical protein
MGSFQRRFIAALLASATSLALPLAAKAEDAPKWGAHLDLEGKAGTDRNLGEGDLFLPLAQTDTTLVFGDMRMRFDDQESQEANVGLGVRHMLPSGWNLGAYGYFDRRGTENDSKFSQATLGLEALSTDWDFRVNGYIPLGDDSHTVGTTAGGTTAELSGASVLVITTPDSMLEERALGGFDAEVGWRLPLFDANNNEQLRFYVGGYRFAADGVEDVAGPRARLDFTMARVPFLWEGSRLTLGAEVQHDDPRGTQAFASVRLRIPLYGGESASRLTPQEQRMTDTVVRDIDIVSQTRSVTTGTRSVETATATAGGSALTVIDSASTTGAQMISGVATAGANSTVILSGNFTTTTTTQLQAGQTLVGGGSLAVRSASGKTATLNVPGATINGTPGGSSATVQMANDSTLTGLTINDTDGSGTNSIAVRVDAVSNVRIIGNTLSSESTAVAQTLLVSGASNNVTISNNEVSSRTTGGAANNALNFVGGSGTITGNMFTSIGGSTVSALSLGNSGTTTVTVNDNILSASGGTGFNRAVNYAPGVVVNAGSTGNINNGGVCGGSAPISGAVEFTNGTTCP